MKILTRREYLHKKRWENGFWFGIKTWADNPYISHWKYQERNKGWKAKVIIETESMDVFKIMEAEVWCDENLGIESIFQGWSEDRFLWAFNCKDDAVKFKMVWG